MSDVNVTEKVARAWAEYLGARIDAEAGDARHRGHIVERVRRQERRRSFEAGYAAALAALADPEVQAGTAGVLAGHVLDEYANTCSCQGWEHYEDPYDARIATYTAHVAAEAVEWLRGRAL